MAQNGEYRVSRPKFRTHRGTVSFVRGPRGLPVPCRHVSQFGTRTQRSDSTGTGTKTAGVSGVSSGALCSPGPLLSCDMLLVRYDSGVSIPAFCSVSDNACDAFVATPRNLPFLPPFSLPSIPSPPPVDFIQPRCPFREKNNDRNSRP